MSTDLLSAINVWLSNSWQIMQQTIYPGTNISIAVVCMAPVLILFSIHLLGKMFEINTSNSAQGGGNNKNIKVSKERKGDSH